MALFTVGGHEYRSDPIDALTQFHLTRRLSAVVFGLAPLISIGATTEDLAAVITSDLGANLKLLQPAVEAVAHMSDDDVNYVMTTVASRTYRAVRHPVSNAIDSWVPIWNQQARAFQYEDITMVELVQIVWHVLKDNLSSFTSGSLSPLTA